MATSSDGTSSYANVEYNNYYDPCPVGTTALPSGRNAVQGTPAQVEAQNNAGKWSNGPFTSFLVGIGDGDGSYGLKGKQPGQKICVGNPVGTVDVILGSNSEDRITYEVSVYDRVAFVDRSLNGFAIKVFMNNNLHRTIRPQL